MAVKKQNVVLQLDLDLPRGKIKEFGELLNNSTKIKMDSGKGKDLFSSMNNSIKDSMVEANKLLKLFNKPVKNAGAAKQLGDSFSGVFKDLSKKLLSFQGNMAKTFNSKENQEAIALYKELGNTIEDLNKKYKKVSDLNSKSNAIGNKGTITKEINAAKKKQKDLEKTKPQWTQQEKQQYEELNNIIEEGNTKLKEKERISKRITKIHTQAGVGGQAEFESTIKELTQKRADIGGGMLSAEDIDIINQKLTEYRTGLKLVTDDLGDFGERSEDSWNQINISQEQSAKKIKTFKEVLQGLGLGFSIQELARGFKQLLSYSFDFYKQLDKALTNIAIVTRKAREEVQSFTKDFISMARQTGMSIDDIAQGAVIFFQQGLSDEEALKMTRVAAEFAKVADITVESASDKLTAAVNGYNMAVSQAADVADKLNVLAAESAASIDELATAMEKGASMASQAGLSFDQYNAILATMIEVTREAPENIGTSMKTIMARFQQIKEAGTTEDGDTDVNAVETALKSVGVALRDEQGVLRDLGDVLDDLGPKWNSLDRNTQAYLGTVIAGTRQQSRFISLMQNWDRALELTTASEQSAGAQALQHQAAMEGLEASINNLTIAWQKFLANLTSSDTFKGFLNLGTKLLNILTKGSVKGKVFTAGLIAGFVLLNKHLSKIQHNINILGDDKVQKSFLYKLNAEMVAFGDNAAAIGKKNAIGHMFKAVILDGTKFGNVLLYLKMLWSQNSTEAMGFFARTANGFKNLAKQAGSSIANMFAKNPMLGLMLGLAVVNGAAALISGAIFDGEEKLEKANKQLEETLNKMEIAQGKQSIIASNLDTYLELSNAISLSVEEQEKLNNATEALAENVKEAVIGYDEMGKAILDISKIELAQKQAKKDEKEAAQATFGDVGESVAADFEARGEENFQKKWWSGVVSPTTLGTVGALAGMASGAAIAGKIGAAIGTAIAPGVGTAIGVVVGGLVGAAIGGVTSAIAAKSEEEKLARKEYMKILREHQEELQKAADTITDSYVSYVEDIYDEHGRILASAEDKQQVAGRMQTEFLNSQVKSIGDKVASGKLDPDEAAEELKNVGKIWEDLLIDIGDEGVNAITAQAMALKKAVDTENKSWNEIKDSMTETLDNLDIPEESRKAIEEAFKASVYSGTSKGVYQAMKDLEAQQEAATSKEAYNADTGGKAWYKPWTWGRQGYDDWKADVDAEYEKYWNMINNMGSNQLNAYGNMGLTTNKDVLELYNSKYAGNLTGALPLNNDTATNLAGLSGLYSMKDEIDETLRGISDTSSAEYKKWEKMAQDTEAAIAQTWNNLPMAVEPTWEQLFEQYEKFTERVGKVWETLGEIKADGGIDYDQFKELTTLFDDIDTQLFSPDQLEQYAAALNTIASNLTLVDGELQLNEAALQSLGDLEQTLAEAQVEGVKNKLLAKKAELEAQKSMVEADLAYMRAQLTVAESVVSGNYNQEESTKLLNEAKKGFTSNAAKLLKTYTDNEMYAATAYANYWSTAFDKVADEYNKLLYARLNGTKADNKVVTSLQVEGAKLKPTTEGLYNFSADDTEGAAKAIKELRANIAAAEHTIKAYDVSIGNINLKLATLNSGIKTTKEGYAQAGKELDEYISKLEKFLDLLRHIEREEMNLKIAEQLEEMQTGVKVLDRMADQLRYTQHLIGDAFEMYNNYEKEANDSAAEIRKGFGDMVSFDEWGNYKVDMAAYNKLSDEKKKLLDESLEAYQDLISERDNYYEKYLDYTKKQIDINQKYVDKYIEAEDELVEAIKQREQKILDNKLAAIDKEIEAIEKAADARKKAREEEKNAQELSSMQVDLQRALMDSSGASASQILSIQKQIKDKQQEIADNSFDTMVDDMKTQLEEEKEMEQKLFDERLEEMDWYWDEVDRIMAEGTESIIETMQLYVDEFNQASEVQQAELLKSWSNTFEQATHIGEAGAKKYQSVVSSLQTEANKLTVDEDILTESTINTKYTGRPKTDEDTAKKTTTTSSPSKPKTDSNPKPTETKKELTWKDSDYGNQITTGLEKTGAFIGVINVNGKLGKQNLWRDPKTGKLWYWKGALGKYLEYTDSFDPKWNTDGDVALKNQWPSASYWEAYKNDSRYNFKKYAYKNGGMVYGTGPAWLDGTYSQPEAVLNAMQTKAFLSFTDDLAALRAEGGISTNSSVIIDNISFNVESMSSVADGEKAFNAFVDKFKEIGAKQGISVLGTANRN